MATVSCLPDELLLKVFSHLDVQDFLSVKYVCTRWNRLAHDSILWNGLELVIGKDMSLMSVLRLLPHLDQLKFVNVQNRVDTADLVDALTAHCPHLVGVRFTCGGHITRESLANLFANCQDITELRLGACWSLPRQLFDDGVLLKNLTSLNLSHRPLTPTQFRQISVSCKRIVSLNIDFVRGIPEDDLVLFISARRNLQSLTVFGDTLTDNFFKHIQSCLMLRLLRISTCINITDRCFDSLESLRNLRSLTLKEATQLTSNGLYKFYFESAIQRNLSYVYISVPRHITAEVVTGLSNTNFKLDDSVIGSFCSCVLSKNQFKVYILED